MIVTVAMILTVTVIVIVTMTEPTWYAVYLSFKNPELTISLTMIVTEPIRAYLSLKFAKALNR